jgi:hypothetical protein
MDDLTCSADDGSPLGLDDYRLLRLVARSPGSFMKLPLRFKFDHDAVDKLADRHLLERGASGWPGVPGYRITIKGSDTLRAWLRQGRSPPPS